LKIQREDTYKISLLNDVKHVSLYLFWILVCTLVRLKGNWV